MIVAALTPTPDAPLERFLDAWAEALAEVIAARLLREFAGDGSSDAEEPLIRRGRDAG